MTTTVTTAAETNDVAEEPSEAALYEAFLESRQWALLEDGAGDFVDRGFEITAQKMFDFDGDGVEEFWLRAKEPENQERINKFYTIQNAQVKELLSGFAFIGTQGGDEIAVYYDTQTKQHLMSLVYYESGGTDGRAHSITCYEYKNGQLREVLDLDELHLRGRDPVYTVNGKQATEEEYNKAYARLTEPTDKKFLLEETP